MWNSFYIKAHTIMPITLAKIIKPKNIKWANNQASGIFRFRGRRSILIPAWKHSRGVNICLSWLLNFQGSPLYHPPNGTLGLAALDDDTVDWLQTAALCIWWCNRPKRRSKPSREYSFNNRSHMQLIFLWWQDRRRLKKYKYIFESSFCTRWTDILRLHLLASASTGPSSGVAVWGVSRGTRPGAQA